MPIIYYFHIIKFHCISKNTPSSLFNINNIFSSKWVEYIFWEQKKNSPESFLPPEEVFASPQVVIKEQSKLHCFFAPLVKNLLLI